MVGLLSGATVDGLHIPTVLMKKLRLQGINVGSRTMFESMNRAIDSSKLRPVIDRAFSFEQAPQALNYLAQGTHFGKVCITF
ncbi:hypothetical protein D3C78_1571850 [compost metagenome]